MFDYKALETELAARINAKLLAEGKQNRFNALAYPDNEGEFANMVKRSGQISQVAVQYIKSKYSDSLNTNEVLQDEQIVIGAMIFAATMHGNGGITDCKNHVQKYLFGYTPQNCSLRIRMLEFEPVEIENMGMFYRLSMQTTTTQAQVIDLDETENQVYGLFKPDEFELNPDSLP